MLRSKSHTMWGLFPLTSWSKWYSRRVRNCALVCPTLGNQGCFVSPVVRFVASRYNQYYSADAFSSASGTDIDDSYFMEGITIAHVDSASSRHHLYSAAVGLTYDSEQPDYNCPAFPACAYSDSDYCIGPAAPLWMGKNVYCDSGNSGTWEATW